MKRFIIAAVAALATVAVIPGVAGAVEVRNAATGQVCGPITLTNGMANSTCPLTLENGTVTWYTRNGSSGPYNPIASCEIDLYGALGGSGAFAIDTRSSMGYWDCGMIGIQGFTGLSWTGTLGWNPFTGVYNANLPNFGYCGGGICDSGTLSLSVKAQPSNPAVYDWTTVGTYYPDGIRPYATGRAVKITGLSDSSVTITH
jgi:hypothetical protein